MAIRAFEPERVTISYKDKPLMEVRGLNLVDITVLMKKMLPYIRQTMALIDDEEAALAAMADPNFLMRIASEVPEIAFAVVELAAEVTSDEEKATLRKIPVGPLVDALTETVRMTVEDIGGPNVLAATVMQMIRGISPRATSLAASLSGEAAIMSRIRSYDSFSPAENTPAS